MTRPYAMPKRDRQMDGISRRECLAWALGAERFLLKPGFASENAAPIRLAVSESLVSEVNLNDARAAMQIWLKRMEQDLNLSVDFPFKVFETTEEIVRKARAGLFDAVALNVVEYRQIADTLDPTHVIAATDGGDQYLLLVKRNGPVRQLNDLRGKRLMVLHAPRMCLADQWLTTVLREAHLGDSDRFFAAVTPDQKPARVVLPVFFGQADACVTSLRGFQTMGELNPQVARELTAIATSPTLVVTFYTFHKNYHGVSRERFAKLYTDMPASPAGRQIAVLFQFQGLAVQDVACLGPALAILEASERAHRPGASK